MSPPLVIQGPFPARKIRAALVPRLDICGYGRTETANLVAAGVSGLFRNRCARPSQPFTEPCRSMPDAAADRDTGGRHAKAVPRSANCRRDAQIGASMRQWFAPEAANPGVSRGKSFCSLGADATSLNAVRHRLTHSMDRAPRAIANPWVGRASRSHAIASAPSSGSRRGPDRSQVQEPASPALRTELRRRAIRQSE